MDNCVCPVQNLALLRDLPKVTNFNFVEDPVTNATGLQISVVSSPELGSLKVVLISAIKEKLVYMHFEGDQIAFVSRFPNKAESD